MISHRIFICILSALVISASVFANEKAGDTAVEYRYWDWGKTPLRDNYQFDVLNLALQKTVPQYGPYKSARVVRDYTAIRSRREVNRGIIINIQPGPWRDIKSMETDPVISVDVPAVSLLGFRQLIIRKEDLELFSKIKTEAELKNLVVGQGHDWIDVDVYKHNNYKIDNTSNLPQMLDMLVRKRFDYIPMSIIEVESVLSQRPDLVNRLAVVPNLFLYYPFPIVFYIGTDRPDMKQRMEEGLKIIEKDGSMIELHKRYFYREIAALQDKSAKIFALKNPAIPQVLLDYESNFYQYITNKK